MQHEKDLPCASHYRGGSSLNVTGPRYVTQSECIRMPYTYSRAAQCARRNSASNARTTESLTTERF